MDHRFFPGNFWFDRFSYGIDNRSNSIDHFQKIGTTKLSSVVISTDAYLAIVVRGWDKIVAVLSGTQAFSTQWILSHSVDVLVFHKNREIYLSNDNCKLPTEVKLKVLH